MKALDWVHEIAESFTLRVTAEFGRGLYATRIISPGDVIMTCELLVLSEADTKIVNQTELQHYTFKFTDSQDCLCLGLGEIFNHSDMSNVAYELVEHDGRKVMQFTAKRFILADEQLFIDYAADTPVDVNGYVNSVSMME